MSSSSRTRKRQRTGGIPAFGAASEADRPSSSLQNNDPSSNAFSFRVLPHTTVPTLANICARLFVHNFKHFRENTSLWDRHISHQLQLLPEAIVPRLFAMLRNSQAGFLPHEIIVTFFFRGSSLVLPSSLPGANKSTILAISRINPHLRELELSGFDKLADDVFASTISHLSSLRTLVLRGCTKVGAKTIAAVAKSCRELRKINLNHTSVAPAAAAALVMACGTELEVLKLAGISNWTDGTFAKFSAPIEEQKARLPALHTLKLRELSLSDHSVDFFIGLCPNLRRLDISFTLIKCPSALTSPLEKLSLTSTAISGPDVLTIVERLPKLQTLSLGALGVRQGLKTSISNSSAMTLDDRTLHNLTDILSQFQDLRSVSLVSNTKLGTTSKADAALLEFIQRVGRKCQYLNLSGITALRAFELAGLVPENEAEGPPALKILILNNTGIDDDSAPYIACCADLETLEVGGTKFTSEGLFSILDACPRLERLDLTSCRGVRVADRRRFFEVWMNERTK